MISLTADEARVLGCLMEKAVTTPDNYPLSVNALLSACNQTTNRDPIVKYDENLVEHVLESLRNKDLCRRVRATGGRVVKHRHIVDEAIQLTVPEFAVLGVLLLRGAQTPGELKQRTERWHSFRSLDDLEATLDRLREREMVRQLERRPGQKESRWITLIVENSQEAFAGAAPAVQVVTGPAPAAAPAVEAPAVRPPEEHSLTIRNPATGETIRTVAITADGEVAQKVARARKAQPAWAARAYDERAGLVRAFRDLLAAEADECAALTSSEMGKPVADARSEAQAVLARIDWNLEHVEVMLQPRDVDGLSSAVQERITYEPVGVVAHIGVWNYPYFVTLNSLIPALLTGSTVLYKPSEYATLTGLRIVDLMHRAGLPVDVVHAVVGSGAAGRALINDDVDMICFTGSVPTGKAVAAVAAERLVRCQLELGGKDAAYVADDVDIDGAALAVAEGAFYNAGQSCAAIERVYVHDAVYERFLDAFVEAVQMTEVGPLARAQQLDVLTAHVQDAREKGARVLIGGERIARDGNWFPSTVIADANSAMRVMRDESFGPIIGVQRVLDDDDAVTQMDNSEFGLGAAVFTNDQARAERILEQLDVGNAYWNTSDRSAVTLPWAGRRHSGLGVSMSESGIRTFLKEKAWHLKP